MSLSHAPRDRARAAASPAARTTYRTLEERRSFRSGVRARGVDALIAYLEGDPGIRDAIVARQRVPARVAELVEVPASLHPALRAAIQTRGWQGMYSHQASATAAARAGRNVVIVTPTASGKTLAYNLPVLDTLLRKPMGRALYLYPTKALSRDQLAELHDLIAATGVSIPADVYDGDTPDAARSGLRRAGRIILSNPDMLHAAILPNHTKWIGFFQGLEWIVIDELHQYRGVFGSHVGNVLRRLKRICRFYGSEPRMICTSATIGNPGELAEHLFGEPVEVIDRSGAPAGPREIWLCNPPVTNPSTGLRANPLALSVHLAAEAMLAGNPTILFCRGRMEVEVALTLLRDRVPGVESYRGGYLPSERRAVERRLRDGALPGVVSTNALELGIDIGSLDVAISCGYPGSLASARQQMGRAGRRQGTSLAVMVAGPRPLDQYLVQHPEFFFDRSPEHAVVDLNNDLIRATQLRCAAFELPFDANESFGGPDTGEFLEFFAEEGILHRAGSRYYWSAESFPAREVSLRSAADENVTIIDGPPPEDGARPLAAGSGGHTRRETVIGEIDRAAAVTMLHDQAIYLHRGQQYHVDRFDYAERKAWVSKVDVEYYTQAELSVEVKVLAADAADTQGAATARLGDVTLSIIPTIFKKLKIHGHENIGAGPINLPEERMQTSAFWLEWPADAAGPPPAGRTPRDERGDRLGAMSGPQLEAGLAGLAHLLRGLAPLFAMCDRSDIGATPKLKAPESGLPTLYLYDQYPGGVGLTERLFRARTELIRTAAETLSNCACEDGCPSCVGPSHAPGDRKTSTARLLLSLMA